MQFEGCRSIAHRHATGIDLKRVDPGGGLLDPQQCNHGRAVATVHASRDEPAPYSGIRIQGQREVHSRLERTASQELAQETNAQRTDAAVQRFLPGTVGTRFAFRSAAIASSDIPFASIALICVRHP